MVQQSWIMAQVLCCATSSRLDRVWCTLDDTSIVEAEPSKIQDKECKSKGTRKIRITGKSNR